MKQSLLLRIKTLNNHKNKNLESLSVLYEPYDMNILETALNF